jgi:hypothetical protein
VRETDRKRERPERGTKRRHREEQRQKERETRERYTEEDRERKKEKKLVLQIGMSRRLHSVHVLWCDLLLTYASDGKVGGKTKVTFFFSTPFLQLFPPLFSAQTLRQN